MKLFHCQHCRQVVHFTNTQCLNCGHLLAYLPERTIMSAIREDGNQVHALAAPGEARRLCENAAHQACNWLIPAEATGGYCIACRHNRTIPDLDGPNNLAYWQRLEDAKHRLFYTLVRLDLPLPARPEDPKGLCFDFLADDPDGAAPAVMTGHADGLITIALREADDGERETLRAAMGEPYRTLLGHFRHEVGHFFWDRLVFRDADRLESSRVMFGDDREDYGAALERHYQEGPPSDWQERYVSRYASSHAWEDFAETWAHYLHIIDTLETAGAFGLQIGTNLLHADRPGVEIDFDPHGAVDFTHIINAWLPLTFAVNSLNRSMGQPDLYPFVLSPVVIDKLAWIHDLVHDRL